MSELPEHVRRNRSEWDSWAADFVGPGERNWAADEESWGIWEVPEARLGLLSDVEAGMDSIELGCGTGYVSAWLARRGCKPVAIDNSKSQLATAKRLQGEHGIEFPLIHGNAEQVPYPDASFDLAISEYGASIWADPDAWVSEAARLLRPGGRLIFLVNSTVLVLCMPDDERPATSEMLRPQRGLRRLDWEDDGSVEFILSHGDWIALLTRLGFVVERLAELYPADDATSDFPYATADWARQWPTEEVWVARKS